MQFTGERIVPGITNDSRDVSAHIARYVFAMHPFCTHKIVLDASCFPADTKITVSGWQNKPISEISPGETVLDHLGCPSQVIAVSKRAASEMVSLHLPYGYDLRCTPEHPLLCVPRASVACKHDRAQSCNTSDNGACSTCGKESPFNPLWVMAEDVKEGDFLCVPKPRLSHRETVSLSLARVLGYYLAEGSLVYSHKPKICAIDCTFNFHHRDAIAEMISCAQTLGPKSITLTDRPDLGRADVIVYGKAIAEEFLRLGGKYAAHKRVHPEIYGWSLEEIREMLRCWIQEDGYYKDFTGSRGVSWVGATISESLAQNVRDLLKMLGVLCGVMLEQRGVGEMPCYRLTVSGEDINSLVDGRVEYKSKKRYRENDDFFFIPVCNAAHTQEEEIVYNLTVEGEHTYIANGLAVHNCGVGYGTQILSWAADSAFGVDIEPAAIEYAEEMYGTDNTTFVVGDVTKMQFPDGFFDVVVSFETIEHLSNPGAFVDEVWRVLRPNGVFIVSAPENSGSVFHRAEYSADGLEALLGAFPEREYYGQAFGLEHTIQKGVVPHSEHDTHVFVAKKTT